MASCHAIRMNSKLAGAGDTFFFVGGDGNRSSVVIFPNQIADLMRINLEEYSHQLH